MEEQLQEGAPQEEVKVEETPTNEDKSPMSYEDGVIKVDLSELNKTQENTAQEQEAGVVDVNESTETSEQVVEEIPQQQETVQAEQPVLEEITEEEVAEQAEELEDQVEQALIEADAGVELPENIQKVVDFMNDTGGSLEDYVKLNTDYSALNETQLLREYYENTRPHLDKEEIDFLMEDNFAYDEELDEERDIRKKKIAHKEELAKAKNHLDGLKSKYYEEIKAGSKLNPEQQKAVQFFNRYNKEQEETTKLAENQKNVFLDQTSKVFNNDFKGFDYQVGDKKYRFNVKNAEEVKTNQSDINNFVKKFLNEKNEMSDASGYHKSLFTAMNPDAVAKHFYEQGKADAIKDSMAKTKNINMDPRGVHENTTAPNGWTVRSVNGVDSSKLRVKIRK
jgi:hypothetical protein